VPPYATLSNEAFVLFLIKHCQLPPPPKDAKETKADKKLKGWQRKKENNDKKRNDNNKTDDIKEDDDKEDEEKDKTAKHVEEEEEKDVGVEEDDDDKASKWKKDNTKRKWILNKERKVIRNGCHNSK